MADLHRYHGVRLVEVREHITATELADWVAHLPDDAATRRAVDPAWRQTDSLEMLRAILLRLDYALWQNGGGNGERPEPIRFAWEPDPDAEDRPDSMTTEELVDWLDDDARRDALGVKG